MLERSFDRLCRGEEDVPKDAQKFIFISFHGFKSFQPFNPKRGFCQRCIYRFFIIIIIHSGSTFQNKVTKSWTLESEIFNAIL